jgi:hypothetical protein
LHHRYLKNILVKYMETGDHESLFPVLCTILQLSPEEQLHIKQKRQGKGFFGLEKLFK